MVAGVVIAASFTGCAPVGMQIQNVMARGEPIDKYCDVFGRQSEVEAVLNGQPTYT